MELKDGTKLMRLLLTENEEITKMSDEEILETVKEIMKTNPYMHVFNEPSSINPIPEIVYCRDCIHRPIEKPIGQNYNLAPKDKYGRTDYTCPFICVDSFYTQIPEDDFYCKAGEAYE